MKPEAAKMFLRFIFVTSVLWNCAYSAAISGQPSALSGNSTAVANTTEAAITTEVATATEAVITTRVANTTEAAITTETTNSTEASNSTCLLQGVESGLECDAVGSSGAFSDLSVVTVEGTANISATENGELQIKSNLSVTTTTEFKCPGLQGAGSLTQTQLIERLTAPCRYDRLERPIPESNGSITNGPVDVYARTYIYVMQNLDTSDLQFKMHGLLQLRYVDTRLAFGAYAPKRNQPILGESQLRSLIWVPHIFLANEHDSSVLGTNEKDILTSIATDGTVIISSRIQATLYCWMNLQKFPFDEQDCSTIFESWMYNSSELMLHWEQKSPITFDPKMHLTEYAMQNAWSNETIINADLDDLRHGAFAGNYSSLSFTVHLTREVGYYMMDYFLPSMMIVAISWVSFWLQADQTPARTTLGTSTMLSFITLASAQENNLPKVSYIKVSEVWFLGCTLFIFGSLVEFAFVNTIWRRNRNLELKKINSKYIFKSTLTPSMNRRKIESDKVELSSLKSSVNNFLTVDTPVIITDMDAPLTNNFNSESFHSSLSIEDNAANNPVIAVSDNNDAEKNSKDKEKSTSWSTMSPHEVSLWVDRKARFVFPLAFLIFNALFWTFVYCL